MKVLSIVLSIYFSCFSFHNNSDKLDAFAKTLLNHCIEHNLHGLLSLKVSKDEIKTVVISSSFPENIKNELLNKFSDDELVTNITRGLKRFKETIKESKSKKQQIKFVEFNDKTRNVRGVFMGTVEIFYTCKDIKHKIIVEIIKTEQGWKIMDDVFVD